MASGPDNVAANGSASGAGAPGAATPGEKAAAEIRERLGVKIVSCEVRSQRRVYVEVAASDWPEAAMHLWGERHARFNIATGTQTPQGFEVLYHFSLNEGDERGEGGRQGVVVSVRVRAEGGENPAIPSVASRIKAMNFIEREIHDLLGITFTGHPNLAPLLTAEDWPKDFFPLRRTEKRSELDFGKQGAESGTGEGRPEQR